MPKRAQSKIKDIYKLSVYCITQHLIKDILTVPVMPKTAQNEGYPVPVMPKTAQNEGQSVPVMPQHCTK